MVSLYPEKLLNIITTDTMEEKLVTSFKKLVTSLKSMLGHDNFNHHI